MSAGPQPVVGVEGWNVGSVHALHIWMYPLRICSIEDKHTNHPDKKKTCDTLPHPLFASVGPPWLQTAHFSKNVCTCKMFCAML